MAGRDRGRPVARVAVRCAVEGLRRGRDQTGMLVARQAFRTRTDYQPVVKVQLHSAPPTRLPRWGPRSAGAGSGLGATAVKESAATEEQQHHHEDE
jgi:hypothetical protein